MKSLGLHLLISLLAYSSTLFAAGTGRGAQTVLFPEIAVGCRDVFLPGFNASATPQFPKIGPEFRQFSTKGLALKKSSSGKEETVLPLKGRSFLNDYALLLQTKGVALRLSKEVSYAGFLASGLVILLNPKTLENMTVQKERELRLNLRHETEHAEFYMDYRAGKISPLHAAMFRDGDGSLSPKSIVYKDGLSFEELYTNSRDLLFLARQLGLVSKIGSSAAEAFDARSQLFEKIHILRNIAESAQEVLSRPRENTVQMTLAGRFARSDESPRVWISAWLTNSHGRVRLAIPASARLNSRAGKSATEAEVLQFVDSRISGLRKLSETIAHKLGKIEALLDQIGIFKRDPNLLEQLELSAEDLVDALPR